MITEEHLRKSMTDAMRGLLGSGYVPEYYEQLAGDFVQVALWYAEAQVKQVPKPEPYTRDDWTSLIGEGIHTGFRKGTEHPEWRKYYDMIAEMPEDLWEDVLCYTVDGLSMIDAIEISKEK